MRLKPRAKQPKSKRPPNLSKQGVVKWLLDGAIKVTHDRLPTPCLVRPDLHKTEGGYTKIRFQRKMLMAHRLVFEVLNGPISEGLYILHECDNRACLNPKHLHEGTHQDNMDEMWQRGRTRPGVCKGEQNGRARLTAKDVITIREIAKRGVPRIRIEGLYGISSGVVSDIINRRYWKHV